MDNKDDIKKNKRLVQKAEKEYLKGRFPKLENSKLYCIDGSIYIINKNGSLKRIRKPDRLEKKSVLKLFNAIKGLCDKRS